MKFLKNEAFEKKYGDKIVSVYLIGENKKEKYIKPTTKGVWLIEECLKYDICTAKKTYHYRNFEITNG